MFGVSIGYHRFLAHRSFKAVRWFEVLIIFLGLPAGTPIQWAGNHRAHHRNHDTEKDPHSPHFGGFWWAHTGWYINSKNPVLCLLYSLAGPLRTLFDAWFRPRTNQEFNHLARDIKENAIFAWMSDPLNYLILVYIHTLGFSTLVFFFYGLDGLLVMYLGYVYVYNIGDAVDSVGHLWGARNEDSSHKATNNLALGFLAFGDGWHGNHHDNPGKAKHGKLWWQLDISYLTIKVLYKLRLIKTINE